MKTVKIKECSYEKFEAIRDIIYEKIPFAVFHIGYSKKLKMAIFSFWDSHYISEKLEKFVMPLNKVLMDQVNKEIEEIFK